MGRRSLRGSPIVVVADAQGKRYHIPLWMTLPEAAEWGLREVPRLSLAALADLRDLLSAFLREPSPAGKEESHANTTATTDGRRACSRPRPGSA